MKFSIVIPAKDKNDPQLKELLDSIEAQRYPSEDVEVLVITEGDSEQAKGIGAKRARGDIVGFFCCDNLIVDDDLFLHVANTFRKDKKLTGFYSNFYEYKHTRNSLERYFALMGYNDPIPYYLGKCDRKPHHTWEEGVIAKVKYYLGKESLGDNGFFFRRDHLVQADLDHFYPMDICVDLEERDLMFYYVYANAYICHRTTNGNLLKFLWRRYKYARDLYCNRTDRRWKIISGKKDYCRLSGFIFETVLAFPAILRSSYRAIYFREPAYLWEYPVNLGFLIMYTILQVRTCLKQVYAFVLSTAKRASTSASMPLNNRL